MPKITLTKDHPKTPEAEYKFYDKIQRGCSLTIPVTVKNIDDSPVDLTDMTVYFTVKRLPGDFDQFDDRAYIAKQFAPQEAANGKFKIELSSKDLFLDPEVYYFDIELATAGGAVTRLTTMKFNLISGPTNRSVNAGIDQIAVGSNIDVIFDGGLPIVAISPFIPPVPPMPDMSEYLKKSGGVMTGMIELPDQDPQELEAVNKKYVDIKTAQFVRFEPVVNIARGTNPRIHLIVDPIAKAANVVTNDSDTRLTNEVVCWQQFNQLGTGSYFTVTVEGYFWDNKFYLKTFRGPLGHASSTQQRFRFYESTASYRQELNALKSPLYMMNEPYLIEGSLFRIPTAFVLGDWVDHQIISADTERLRTVAILSN